MNNPPSAPNQPDNGVAWWFKMLAKAVGVISGLIAMITGVVTCITVHPICLVAGIFQVLSGFVAVLFEAPCCCPFLDFVNQIGKFSENRPYWQKAIFYGIIAIIPIGMCFSLTTIFGSGFIFVTGSFYGLMALGKKADRQDMLLRIRGEDVEMKKTLMTDEEHVELEVPSADK